MTCNNQGMTRAEDLTLRVIRNIKNPDKREQAALSVIWMVAQESRGDFLAEAKK